MSSANGPSLSLDDRFLETTRRAFLGGNHVLIRMMVEQMRSDRAAGLRTRAFATGYPGSPLGSIDLALKQSQALLEAEGITHRPAQNEEFAASSLMGTQMLDEHPHPDVDGVVGYWYGKGPGLDRSGDALKHGNFAGVSRHGAVVILSGEDHEAKSSTVPYQQEFFFEHHGMPVLYPASVQEFLDYGLHAAALSRFSGCWVALKLVGTLCDGGQVVEMHEAGLPVATPPVEIDGRPFEKKANHRFFPVVNIETERALYHERHAAVLAYARANGLNRVVARAPGDRIGIISAGKSWSDTMEALADLGLHDGLAAYGIRLAKAGLICPLDKEFVRDFAEGLDTVIVVEEKRDFLERQVAAALVGTGVSRIYGKTGPQGEVLFPMHGGLSSDAVAATLGRVLAGSLELPAAGRMRLERLAGIAMTTPFELRRQPNYCSGCPHNASTLLAPGQIAWGAPGCHLFATLMDKPQKRVEGTTQLGGEGLPWIGLSPFTSRQHIVQNVGDGALFHSSLQNIRYAVETGVNITFKLLINGVLANTGGQVPVTQTTVMELLPRLALEKVTKIVVITKERDRYDARALPRGVELRPLEALEATMSELAALKGVTIVIYDGACANERRRRQKRGLLPKPTRFTFVNEDVCENCGDCGAKANCMSLQKVETEFGDKTSIHQSSCNQDRACLEGECPSFVTVDIAAGVEPARPRPPQIDAARLPEPVMARLERPYQIYIPGLGGTGVLTANAILAQAAALDGLDVRTYDQTGASQKWGPVLSSLIVAPKGMAPSVNTVGYAKADLYLALDLLAAIEPANLARCSADRTVALVNSGVLPTGQTIRDPRRKPPRDAMVEAIAKATRVADMVVLDARRIAEELFSDYLMTNMVAIGAAYQAGRLPISAASIEAAISLNGVSVNNNLTAFRAGRLSQCDPQALEVLYAGAPRLLADRVCEQAAAPALEAAWQAARAAHGWIDPDTARLLEPRFKDLIGYQNLRYATAYLDKVAGVARRTHAVLDPKAAARIVHIVARNLHKLLAYKDEYEVARLLTQPGFEARIRGRFTGKVRISYNLQPPLIRRLGMKRKVRLGPWFRPALLVLKRLKALRGTPLDPFGRMAARREERELIAWYGQLVDETLHRLRPDTAGPAADLLDLPETIKGYEHIKARAAQNARRRADRLVAANGCGNPELASGTSELAGEEKLAGTIYHDTTDIARRRHRAAETDPASKETAVHS
ncbi:indolepyruvate ferredoxin oxidoreductase family protein [Chelativorans alearense]|uniref:indolepyruvate ferredoxin oxidoreductase family protein n=1 Tax=Chelativorans alearense TaxID=2681495 RepID=UPI0013D1D01B|nr:indolepyruvate ferredoxin oxidoreductase family protein [Chelativorans alearense]